MLRRTNYRKIRKTDWANFDDESTIDSEGFKGGTRGAPIMPGDAVSRTANVERTGRHKWVKMLRESSIILKKITRDPIH